MQFARRRDANERPIIEALEKIGASVTRLSDTGVPDLLVGYRMRTFLLEVKNPSELTARAGKMNREGGAGMLTPSQVTWWSRPWDGGLRYIVETEAEALAVVRVAASEDEDGAAMPVYRVVAERTAAAIEACLRVSAERGAAGPPARGRRARRSR